MKDNFNCPHCNQPILITTGNEIKAATKRHDELALRAERFNRQMVDSIEAAGARVLGRLDDAEFEGACDPLRTMIGGQQMRKLGVPLNYQYDAHWGDGEVLRNTENATPFFADLVNQFRCEVRRLKLQSGWFRPMPHVTYGPHYWPVNIDLIPARALMSYSHPKAGWIATIDAGYLDPRKFDEPTPFRATNDSWIGRPSQL